MYIKHRIFGFIFNIFKIFPLNKNRISFIIDSNKSFNSNIDYIYNELKKRDNFQYNFFLKDNLSLKSFFNLATSKYIFLNDNFFPLAFMNIRSETKVIQLWHAPGAFKKFGASSLLNKNQVKLLGKISKNTDFLFVSSDNVKTFYEDAFQIDKKKIMSFGIPRMDYYFKNHDLNLLRKKFDDRYPLAKNKKIILYTPTFRDNEKDNNVFNFLNLKKFNNLLSNEYVLVLRLHPKINKFFNEEIKDDEFIDCTNFKNEQELLLLADILITDYSSIMIEFAMLNKPIIFFAYDLDNYIKNDRGFYFDYSNVPGTIVKNSDDLINIIKENNFNNKDNSKFLKMQFNLLDGNSSARIVDFILNYR